MQTETIYNLHDEHKKWLQKLDFYKDELVIMQKRIAEVASKYTHADTLMQIEHFQNQCIIQQDRISELSHNVKAKEEELEKNINSNPTAADHRRVADDADNREQVAIFERIINDLRKELNEFLTRTM